LEQVCRLFLARRPELIDDGIDKSRQFIARVERHGNLLPPQCVGLGRQGLSIFDKKTENMNKNMNKYSKNTGCGLS
jgi:hypothetical protein